MLLASCPLRNRLHENPIFFFNKNIKLSDFILRVLKDKVVQTNMHTQGEINSSMKDVKINTAVVLLSNIY